MERLDDAVQVAGGSSDIREIRMFPSRVKKNLLCTAIAAAAALGAAGSVQAAVYRGSWDPPYGVTLFPNGVTLFPNLGWSGTSTFFIPDTCAVGTGTVIVACAGMTAGFAQVDLYKLSNPSVNEILNFDQTVSVSKMYFSDGHLTGVDSGFFTPLLATLPAAGSGDYSFSLQFSSIQGAKLFYLKNDTADSDERGDEHNGESNGNGNGKDEHEHEHEHENEDDSPCNLASINIDTPNTPNCGVNDFTNNRAVVTYTLAVPEPATFGLVLAGLGAIGLAMRRRRG